MQPTQHWWARPECLGDANLFELDTLSHAPFLVPDESPLAEGLQRMLQRAPGGFKRIDLEGPQQNTHWYMRVSVRLADLALSILSDSLPTTRQARANQQRGPRASSIRAWR